jgi:hypothetical protein
VDLVAKASNFLETVMQGVEVREQYKNTGIRIVLVAGGLVEGVVVDDTAEPVSGAEVLVRDYGQGLKEHRAVTSPNGRFRVGNLAASDTVEIEVNHDEYGTYVQEDVPVGSVDLRITLKSLGRIRGLVVDPSGAPVDAFSVQPQPQAKLSDTKRRPKARTFNVGDGSFEYSGVPDGAYTVHVRCPAYAVATVEGVQVTAGDIVDLGRIVLQEGGTISGQVIEAETGRPVAGASVRVAGARFLPNQQGKSTAVTGPDGSFSFAGLRDGTFTLEVSHDAFVKERVTGVDTKLPEKSHGLVIEMSTGGRITGTVTDLDGNLAADISVYLMSQGGSARDNRTGKTGRDGRFTFESVSPGRYKLRAHKFGVGGQAALLAEQEIQLETGGSQDVSLGLQPRGR